MRTSVVGAVCAAGLVAALGGCSTALSGLGVATGCTAMGNAEGVSVDLADVLDLDGGPVTVDVVVRTEDGGEVCTAHGTATPELDQPNGARCDGENHHLSLLATSSRGLTPLPYRSDRPRLDARGRESIAIATACGVDHVDLPEGTYSRVGGPLGGPDAPPQGWNSPYQRGWITRDGEEITYTDGAGHREVFRLDTGRGPGAPCG